MSDYYLEEAKRLPVTGTYDVVVAGAGVAGLAAAAAAARNGARTLLIERAGIIGGVATSGLMVSWGVRGRFWDGRGEQVTTGIPWEFHRRIIKGGGGLPSALKMETAPQKMPFDFEIFKKVALEMLEESGVTILFHTIICEVVLDDNTTTGVIIENKSGRQVMRAKQFIDATGDADLCAFAGVEYRKVNGIHSNMMRVGGVDMEKAYAELERHHGLVTPKKEYASIHSWQAFKEQWKQGFYYHLGGNLRNLGFWEPMRHVFEKAVEKGLITEDQFNYTEDRHEPRCDWGFDMQGVEGRLGTDVVDIWVYEAIFDGIDAAEVSRQEIFGYKMTWLFFEEIIRKMPGFESSYIIDIAGDIGIRLSRVVETRYKMTRDEATGGATFPDVIGRYARYEPYREEQAKNPPRGFDVPYRQLLPVGVDNLYVTGKPLAGHCGPLRPMPGCMVTGEGAGTAAAIAAHRDLLASDVPVEELQQVLTKHNVNLGR